MWGWLLHVTGVQPLQPSYWYNFWSGFGANFGEFAIAGGLFALVRKHNCHEPRCWRIGRFPVEGTPWSACRRHHPQPPKRGGIREQHHLYLGKQPGRG